FEVIDFTGLASTNDDCGPVTVTQAPTPGNTFSGIGNTVVLLIATDGSGNTATCHMTLNLEDNLPPVNTNCQGQTFPNDPGQCGAIIGHTESGATDNCDASLTFSFNPPAGLFPVGTTTVVRTVSDDSGNSATCSFSVTVNDTEPPTAVCQNGTVQLNGAGSGGISSSAIDNGSSDNCGAVSFSPASFDFTCSDVGPNTVTLNVIDGSPASNSATCTAVVTVQDNVPPTAVCQNLTIVLSGTSATVSASQVNYGSSDNCPPPALSVSPNTFNCSDVGPNTVTLLVVETSGGTGFSTCTATVTVQDNTPPTALCKSATVQIGETLMASQVDNGSSDNCTNPPGLTVAPNTFGCGNVGSNTVTLTVDDNNGGVSTCSASVTVEDSSPPTAVCANTTVNLDGGGNASIVGADVDGGSSSVCNSVTLEVDPSDFTCDEIGPNTVTLTAYDTGNGLSATCTAVVTVADPLSACCAGPVASCNPFTVQLDALGDGSLLAEQVGGGSTADCGIASTTVVPNSFDCDDIGPNTVTYNITDINGASASCTAVVSVEDNIDPTISCPEDLPLSAEAGLCTATFEVPTPTGYDDNCGVTLVRYHYRLVDMDGNDLPGEDWSSWTMDANQTLEVGYWKIQWQVKDASGNQRRCDFMVTITDDEAPTFTKPANQALTTEGGATCPSPATTDLVVDQDNPIATGGAPFTFTLHGLTFDGPTDYSDNCSSGEDLGLYVWEINEDLNGDADAYQRTIRVRWRVIDAAGNQRTRNQDFTITDDSPPVLTCEEGLTLTFNGEDYFLMEDYLADLVDLANTYDECGGDDITFSIEPTYLSCEDLGETIDVEVTVCDGADPANCTSCTVPVTLEGLPCGWMTWDDHIDCPGSSAGYEVPSETFSVTSYDCSHSPYSPFNEEYAYVKTVLCGNGELIAQVTGMDGLGKAWAGIVMRESNSPGSKKFQVMTGLDYLQHRADWRTSTGGTNQSQSFSRFGQHWLRIVRTGNIFQAYTSYDGVIWSQPVNTQIISMNECLEVGLIVTNVPFATNVTATFEHVQLSPPYVPSVPGPERPDLPVTNVTDAPSLQVYPNPTTGQLTLNLNAFREQDATLEVMDINGQLILQRRLGLIEHSTDQLDLSAYPAGLYFVRLRTSDGVSEVQRVVLQP
ncbi:MAG: HYR domain-containing protein, partial [Lewinella sp.]|nr:HYR domain-containing protein [Lewinella sp.]